MQRWVSAAVPEVRGSPNVDANIRVNAASSGTDSCSGTRGTSFNSTKKSAALRKADQTSKAVAATLVINFDARRDICCAVRGGIEDVGGK